MGVVGSGRRNLHDHAAALGELHRVGQIVQQHLPHAAVVRAQDSRHRRRELDAQIEPLVRSALRDQGDGLVDGTTQIEYLLVQYQHAGLDLGEVENRSEEHTSELQSLMRTSYAVCCLKKNKNKQTHTTQN